jgi:hypothetical protein
MQLITFACCRPIKHRVFHLFIATFQPNHFDQRSHRTRSHARKGRKKVKFRRDISLSTTSLFLQ